MITSPRYVRVIPEDSYDRAYDYAVPEELLGRVRVGMKVRIPLRNSETTGFVVELMGQSEFTKVRALRGVVGDREFIPGTLFRLAQWMAEYYCAPLASALRCVLPEPVRQGMGGQQRQWVERRPGVDLNDVEKGLHRAKKQLEAWHYLGEQPGGWLADLERSSALGRSVWQGLADKGYVTITVQDQERDPFRDLLWPTDEESREHDLNPEQQLVLDAWRKEHEQEKSRPILLHGVTGSGKTEIYLRAIGEVLAAGKTALMVVPEIALTPQAIDRLRARFLGRKIRVAVLHSHLSRGEKHDQWQQAREGRARVVIGARSAVFAPLPELGLVIVDEEHEHTYKQEDAPHYHGRDVAVLRANLEAASIILGSATPSLESWYNVETGKYLLQRLTKRAAARPMPIVHVVDVRQGKKGDESRWLAPVVREAVEKRIELKEQSILYLNRRGHSTSLQCPDCGHVEMCPACSVTLTYHRTVEQLRCHLCAHAAPTPQQCPKCSSRGYRYSGWGTQKIEQSLEKEIPKARVLRMDTDSMRAKHAYAQALTRFGQGEVDVLVGTQMIAKGLDFPGVTCVAVINVDGALQIPDFRSGERVFQQLMQVAGRAGRGDRRGEVFIQTRTPFHPAIQFARHHDYTGFVDQEMEFRKALQYPPYRRGILLTWRGRNEEKTQFVAKTILQAIQVDLSGLAEVSELSPAPISRIEHFFRFHSLILTQKILESSRRLRKHILHTDLPEGVKMVVDVDPLSLL